ncbi:MAG TPA: prolyl oligopeptidase family serine peptidase [Thermoanaerobaculia bacterium]|nr:prolyl oligopeptidase family serine peptidase [Thermoanaerobaculia bacterium]
MKLFALFLIAFAAAAAGAALTYPKAPTSNAVDDYHGTKVADPYRPLEDPDAPGTRQWIDAENRLTRSYLDAIPERKEIEKRLTELWNYERYSPPAKSGGRYFFTRNDGLQNQSPLYVLDRLDGQPRVLLDPNTLSKDGTVSLAGYAVSNDGKLLAYGTASGGSDWNEWHVRDVDTGKDRPDDLKWIKFSGASWTHDDSGFYYSRYDEPAKGKELQAIVKNQKLFFHRLGTPQSEDALIYARPDKPDWFFSGNVTDDGRWLIVTSGEGTSPKTRVYYRDLARPSSDFVKLFDRYDAKYQFIDDVGTTFYFLTDKDAPRGRVVAVDVASAASEPALVDVVPQGDAAIEGVSLVGDRLVVDYLQDASNRVKLFARDGKFEKEIPLPALGTVGGFSGKRTDRETFYSFVSFAFPVRIYRYDFDSARSTVFREPKAPFRPEDFDAKEVFYPSKDGTKIPMFLVGKKGTLTPSGERPTLLYGYGGFDLAQTPIYAARVMTWIERGGLYALACIRGGSEYGEAWHEAGMLGNKQNVFDDFAWAAKWLIAEKYTNSNHLAIHGRSNGGLLVGATVNQHPELFGAAIAQAGVMDMLRYQKFTIGWAWASDYGSSDKPDEFKWLYAYSPVHNVRKGTKYPAVLVLTADHDDRVVPGHSFKYAAAMQAAQAGAAPILIRIETRAGHGGGGDLGSETSVTKQIEESTDILAFLWKNVGERAEKPRK